ncbi:IPT/TIG domain-containing protein [Myxococcota bacterium]|nr:IPT/TIG domain-containing protein [Myxococcota bacterium]
MFPLVALMMSGCNSFGLQELDSSSDESGGTGLDPCAGQPLCIQSLDPSWGPISGGTTVELRGRGFAEGAVVSFGSAALDTTVLDDDLALITTPKVNSEASVDVTITADGETFTLFDGFTYSDADPGDSGGDDSGGVSPTGLVGGLVELSYFAVGCPSCFGASETLDFSVAAALHSPVNGSWSDSLPARGSCARDPATSSLSSSFIDVGSRLFLSAGSRTITLNESAGVYSASGLAQSDYVKNTAWDLSATDGGSWGPFEVNDVLETAEGFTDLQPIAIAEDGARAFTAKIRSTNASFTWSPSGVTDSFILRLDVYNPNGTAFIGSILCHSSDSGALTVPSSAFSGMPSGGLMAVWMYRYQTSEAVLPTNGATLESAASIGLLGTAVLQ